MTGGFYHSTVLLDSYADVAIFDAAQYHALFLRADGALCGIGSGYGGKLPTRFAADIVLSEPTANTIGVIGFDLESDYTFIVDQTVSRRASAMDATLA